MSGNIPYIGSKISLITTADIRYEGILYTLNREDSTIAVQNVRSFGTEGRRCPPVEKSNEIYDFIIFRGKDLKDLTVLQGAPERPSGGSSAFPPATDPLDGGNHSNSLYHGHADTGLGASHGAGAHPSAVGAPGLSAGGMGSGLGRQSLGSSAPPRNGFQQPPGIGAYGYPTSSSGSRPAEKPFGAGSMGGLGVDTRQSFPSAEPPHPMSHAGRRPADDGSGSLASPRTASEEGKATAATRSAESKERGSLMEPKAKQEAAGRGRGKGGTQKKTLYELLKIYTRASDLITGTMRRSGSASIPPRELREMSEMNPAVYHFYLDFANFCCPTHMVQSDEQQWEGLSKALKKHFEKEFGANQPKPQVPQRPNNTLGDFITIETKAAKKNAKLGQRGAGSGAAGNSGGPGGAAGARPSRATARADKKDLDGNSGECGEGAGSQLEDSSAPGVAWACPRCTLKNESLLMECAACGTSKQQAALWAEFPPLG